MKRFLSLWTRHILSNIFCMVDRFLAPHHQFRSRSKVLWLNKRNGLRIVCFIPRLSWKLFICLCFNFSQNFNQKRTGASNVSNVFSEAQTKKNGGNFATWAWQPILIQPWCWFCTKFTMKVGRWHARTSNLTLLTSLIPPVNAIIPSFWL